MSTPYAVAASCWYLHPIDEDTEWVAHSLTEAEAREDLDDDDALIPRQWPQRCVRLCCDSCGMFLGMDGEITDSGMHIDPHEVSEWVDRYDWTTLDRDEHRCDDCPRPDDQSGDLSSRRPGPDDVPLPLDGTP